MRQKGKKIEETQLEPQKNTARQGAINVLKNEAAYVVKEGQKNHDNHNKRRISM